MLRLEVRRTKSRVQIETSPGLEFDKCHFFESLYESIYSSCLSIQLIDIIIMDIWRHMLIVIQRATNLYV